MRQTGYSSMMSTQPCMKGECMYKSSTIVLRVLQMFFWIRCSHSYSVPHTIENVTILQTSERGLNISCEVNTQGGSSVFGVIYLLQVFGENNEIERLGYRGEGQEILGLEPGQRYIVTLYVKYSTAPRVTRYVTLRPKPVIDFSISLDYNGTMKNKYPSFIAVSYAIQRKSSYSSVMIECESGEPSNTTNSTIVWEYPLNYSAAVENIAFGKPTALSFNNHTSHFAVDGAIGKSTRKARTDEPGQKWWRVDLGRVYEIQQIDYYGEQFLCYHRTVACISTFWKINVMSSRQITDDPPCEQTPDHYRRKYTGSVHGIIASLEFAPPFRDRVVTLCGYLEEGEPLEISEVEIFEPALPFQQRQLMMIDELPAGMAFNCTAYAVTESSNQSVLSEPTQLSDLLLTPPLPPNSVTFIQTENGFPNFSFALEPNNTELYEDLKIHFSLSRNIYVYTLENTRTIIFQEGLVPGHLYTMESWTSFLMSHGRVNSISNLTSTFVSTPAPPKDLTHQVDAGSSHLFSWKPGKGLCDGYLFEICTPSKCLGAAKVGNKSINGVVEYTWNGKLPARFRVSVKATKLDEASVETTLASSAIQDGFRVGQTFANIGVPAQVIIATIYSLLVVAVGVLTGMYFKKKKLSSMRPLPLPPQMDKTQTKFPAGMAGVSTEVSEYSEIYDEPYTMESITAGPSRRSTIKSRKSRKRYPKRNSRR